MFSTATSTSRIVRSFLIAGVLLLLSAPLAYAQGYGRITGQVVEAKTGQVLPGASVVLLGTSIGTAANEDGRYVLPRVPAGTYTVQSSFLGYEAATTQITVVQGRTHEQRFSLSPAELSPGELVVLGARAKGQAEALTRQMNAPHITNIVAADQMGRFPDASAPEAVQRLPGISVQRDMGEGRYIQIRGGSSQMTQVTFNGEQVPSPEGSVRQIALDAVPVDILESIEVAKAITPDMDAEAIGGSVNLVTRRAPDERLLNLEGATGYSTIRDKMAGSGSAAYGNRLAGGKFGYLLSGSYNRRAFGSDDLEPSYELGGPGMQDDLLDELEVRHYSLWRARAGGTAMLDYRFDQNSSVYLSGIFSELQDHEQRRRLSHGVGDGTYQADGSVTGGELVFQHKNRRENLRTLNLTAGGEHLLQSGLRVDYHATMTRSQEDTPFDTEIEFVQEGVDFFPDISDRSNIQTNPMSDISAGSYLFESIEPAASLTRNTDYVGALNLSRPYRLGSRTTGTVKFGGKFRRKSKDQDVTENAFELADGAADLILGQHIGSLDFVNDRFNPGLYPYPGRVTTEEEIDAFVEQHQASLDGGHVNEDDVNDYDVTEQTLALYAMTELNLTPKLLLLPGLRMERTALDAEGFSYDPDTDSVSPLADQSDYLKLFPMVHLRYRAADRTNVRAAVTRTLARPNFYDLIPYRLRDDEDLAIGNPALAPTTSMNFDLMFEHYDRLIGVISAGVFYKQITDPIFTFVESNELGGETVQPRNGESGNIRGVEVAVHQQLSFLPGVLDGLGIYSNYTYTSSEATLPSGLTSRLPGQADHVFNVALSYERHGFSGQLSVNYHDDYVDEFGGDIGGEITREADVFIDRHLQVDFSANYRVTHYAGVFLEVVNLTNEPFKIYQGTRDRPRQFEYFERWGRLGLRYSL